mgnify:CR=1 FL=1
MPIIDEVSTPYLFDIPGKFSEIRLVQPLPINTLKERFTDSGNITDVLVYQPLSYPYHLSRRFDLL